MRNSLRTGMACATVFASSIFCVPAAFSAPETSHDARSNAAAAVRSATHDAVVLDAVSPGPSPALQAVLAHLKSNPNQRLALWLVDGKYLVSGALFGPNGVNLSEQLAIQKGLIPKPITGAQAMEIARTAHGFVLGTSGPELIAFEDPNCSACNAFGRSVAAWIDTGRLRVRVIPVGFLKPDSLQRAASILSAKEPPAAWRVNESSFDVSKEEGGYAIGKTDVAQIDAVRANTALLSRINQGQIATPTILYCDKSGQAQITRGWDPDLLSHLSPTPCATER